MSLVSILRSLGLLRATRCIDEERARATTENALVDNDRAFQEMHETYSKVPETDEKLREIIRRSTTPFADLENLMHGEDRRARR